LIELGRVFFVIKSQNNKNNSFTIILGDFNLSADEINDVSLPFSCYQTSLTTIKKKEDGYYKSYDHFCLTPEHFDILKPNFVRIRGPERYYKKDFTGYLSYISDHVPIRMDVLQDNNLLGAGQNILNNIANFYNSQ